MSDVVPLIVVFTLWIPLAAGIAWLFQRRQSIRH
jgi:hypothetical protein